MLNIKTAQCGIKNMTGNRIVSNQDPVYFLRKQMNHEEMKNLSTVMVTLVLSVGTTETCK